MGNYAFAKSFLGASNKPPRNGFDLSRKECYSMPFGTIVPIGFERVQPDEHYKGSLKSYVQTNNMRDDNFCEIHNHMKAVFVPMSSLKRNYLQFTPFADPSRLRKDLALSQAYYQPCITNNQFHTLFFPWFLLADLFKSAVNITSNLLEYKFYCDTGNIYKYITPEGSTLSFSDLKTANPYAAILSIFFPRDISTTSLTSLPYYEYLYNTLDSLRSRSGQYFVYDGLRLADSLGFGNFWPIYSDIVNSIVSSFISDPNSTFTSSFRNVFPIIEDFVSSDTKLNVVVNLDNFPTWFANYSGLVSAYAVTMNLEPLVAYQYYVEMCERSNYRKPSTFVFTLDWFASAIMHNGMDDITSSTYNTNIYRITPSNISGSFTSNGMYYHLVTANNMEGHTSELSLDGDYLDIILYLFGLSNPLLAADLFTSSQLSQISGTSPNYEQLNASSLNTLSAVYKARQALLRAGVRASNYMKSVFGIEGDDNITEPVMILDDTRNNVTITGLINQAATSEAELGERASKGNGGAGLNFSFKSNGFGYIFYVQYMTCEVFYENFMRDRAVTITPANEVSPFDANLGLSPIFNTDVLSYRRFGTKWFDTADSTSVVGFTSRNFELKQKLNKVHGFFTNNPMIYTSTNYSNISSIQKLPTLSRGNAPRGGFVVSLYDQQQDKFEKTGDLYFTFDMLNGIFNQMNDGLLFGSAMFDQFSIITAFNVHKVSPMAVLGLPKLI